MKTRSDYLVEVSSPGKFEQEAPYVPYLWEQSLDGSCDGFGDVTEFGYYCTKVEITTEDIQLFPELNTVNVVYLVESDQGFVTEITKEEYDGYEEEYNEFSEE